MPAVCTNTVPRIVSVSVSINKEVAMFGLFRKDPVKKLEKDYAHKLKQARDLQRSGDIVGFAEMSAAADEILQQIDAEERRRVERSE
jgi:hypothetical protein